MVPCRLRRDSAGAEVSKEKRTLELARVTEVTSIAGGASADRGTYPAKGSHDGRLVSPSLPDHGRNAETIPHEHQIARLKAALKELLTEAKSGQHRHDRSDRECKPMEEAIERAEELLRWCGVLR